MPFRERCLCGADDCPRCRPDTWANAAIDEIAGEMKEEHARKLIANPVDLYEFTDFHEIDIWQALSEALVIVGKPGDEDKAKREVYRHILAIHELVYDRAMKVFDVGAYADAKRQVLASIENRGRTRYCQEGD